MSEVSKVYAIVAVVAAIFGVLFSELSLDVRASILFVVMILASQGMAIVVRIWATRRLLDIPNARSSHSAPVPRGGGIAIVAVTLCVLCTLPAIVAVPVLRLVLLAACGAIIAAIGFIDDLRSTGAGVRLAVHAMVATTFVALVGGFERIDVPGRFMLTLGIAAIPLSILWIVGMVNAYNFMDGINGIAGIQAVVAGLGWAFLGVWHGNAIVALAGFGLAAACAGFLTQNWGKARLFMGDVGSGFLGFFLATLPLLSGPRDEKSFMAGILFLWPFLFDSIFTFLRRLRARENVFTAHRSHLYQRLVIAGASHENVSLLYGFCALLCGVAAIAFVRDWPGSDAIVGLTLVGIPLGVYGLVRRAESRRHSNPPALMTGS